MLKHSCSHVRQMKILPAGKPENPMNKQREWDPCTGERVPGIARHELWGTVAAAPRLGPVWPASRPHLPQLPAPVHPFRYPSNLSFFWYCSSVLFSVAVAA